MKRYDNLLEAVWDAAPEGVIFDMDGLIFDTERLFMEQLAVVMAEQGYQLSRSVYYQSLGMTGERVKELMLSAYGEDYPFEEISERVRQRVNLVADTVGLQLKPQIEELLIELKKKGFPCVVASSTNSTTVKRYLEQAGVGEYFSAVIGGEQVAHSKPEPDIFLQACKLCKLGPEQALVLEDSANGVRAAAAAGIPVICVPDLVVPPEEVCRLAVAVVLR